VDETRLLWLLNSAPTIDGHVQELVGDDDATLDVIGSLGVEPGPRTQESLRRVRDDLQAVIRGTSDAGVLQQHLSGVTGHPELRDGGLTWQPDFAAADEAAARVVMAWADLTTRLPGRLRACANHECSKFLVDHSRPNTARWCSMAECGNRLKARRHSARRSAEQSAP
jgi:predicted RNA-binding Zn ribbon-like protein